MHQQGVDRFFVALDHVEHAVGQARFFQQVGHEECGRWVNRAGLQHKSVAACDGNGEHPHGHHHWEVERRDACHHAQGLAHGPVVDASRDLFCVVAFEQLRNARGEFDNLNAACDFALRIGKHFAVLGGDHVCELVFVNVQQLQKLEHDPRAAQRRCVCPSGECLLRGGYGDVHIGSAGQMHLRRDGARCRVENILRTRAFARARLACDKVGNGGCAHKQSFKKFLTEAQRASHGRGTSANFRWLQKSRSSIDRRLRLS